MLEFWKRVGDQFSQFIKNMSPLKRAALVFTALVVVIGMTSLMFWAGNTDYQVLGTNFVPDDATAIMRVLREKKIPFKVENDGKTIKIPPESVYDLRLELATIGLPQSGVIGYEVFDKQNFGTTSFVQKINEKRAREGELMRTINNLHGVKRSRVHLALPNKSTFIEDQKKPTASVVIDLEPGIILTEKQLQGISHLVASSVEGMELGDVTIIDSNGKMLSKNNTDPLAHRAAAMAENQSKLEADAERKVQEILTRVVGEGKVVAKVSLDIDFSQSSETQTTYDAEGAVVRSEQKDNAVADGSRPVASGAPGATSNTPGPQPASVIPEVRSNTQKTFETKNWAIPEKVTRSNRQPYSIRHISAAVLVDGLYVKDANNPDAPPTYQKWSEEKINEFKTIVGTALGIDPKRGDTVEVKNMEFRKEDLKEAEDMVAASERKKMITNIIQYLVIGIIITLFFIFVVRPFIKWLTDNTVENMESFLPRTIEELEKVQTQEENIATLEEAIPVIVDKVDPEKVEGEMIKEKVITLIENNPHKAAMILHDWVQIPSRIGGSKSTDKTTGGKTA